MVCFVWFVCTGWTFCWVPWGSLGGSLGMLGGGPWVPLGGRSLGGPRSFGCTGCVFCGFRGSLRWSLRLLVDSLGSLGGCPCGFLGGSLGILGGGPWVPLRGGKVLGVPPRLAHGVDVLRGPLRVPWRVLGAPGAFLGVPWGKSVRVPACLTAQSVRLVGSFGGPLEGLGGSWGVKVLSSDPRLGIGRRGVCFTPRAGALSFTL